MSYPSVDKLQKMLAESVFCYAKDCKKASGRALGTLVEIATFYTLCAWGRRDSMAIERPVPEFANHDIRHNVEFSLHPIAGTRSVTIKPLALPLTSAKVLKGLNLGYEKGFDVRPQQILGAGRTMRNAAVVAGRPGGFITAHLTKADKESCEVALTDLLDAPYAIFECKRVGVEEGMKKGPQSIEKAKQGAYVARSVSSLQKVRLSNGNLQGFMDVGGSIKSDDYMKLLRQLIDGTDAAMLRDFILTVGVVSNHGNWFTAEDHNKELKVLAHSYDWLLFLTDRGLCQFIEKLLVNPVEILAPARAAFLASYNETSKDNCFTKVKIREDADTALKAYFEQHEAEVESWFNVIAPKGATITQLRYDLIKLSQKDWRRIRA